MTTTTIPLPSPLKAVTLTHVRYQRGDRLGLFLAWISLVPVFISLGGFISHFIFRRELQGIFFAVGLIVSQFINEVIKTSFQQSRPETCALLEVCDSHGWPSSHCQYMFFFATYLTLLASKGIGFSKNIGLNLVSWSMAFLTMYSRVYLGYHSVSQVFAGTALGVFLGAGWFWFVNTVLFPYFPMIEESALEKEVRGSKLIHQLTTTLKPAISFPHSKPSVRPSNNQRKRKNLIKHRARSFDLRTHMSDIHAPPSPPPSFLFHRPPLLRPDFSSPLLKQRSWSPDVYRDEAWLRRKGNWKNRRCRSKSVTDEDVDELKACIELGFGFESSPEVETDQRLSDTLPALELYYAVNKSYNDSLTPKPSATILTPSVASSSAAASDHDGTPSPHGSPRTAIFGTDDDPQTVKTRLRQWAQVVACAVRQNSS